MALKDRAFVSASRGFRGLFIRLREPSQETLVLLNQDIGKQSAACPGPHDSDPRSSEFLRHFLFSFLTRRLPSEKHGSYLGDE